MGLWCAALPADPEVVAAHALLALCDLPVASGLPAGRALLVDLPALPGPTGAAVALAVGYALAAETAADRTAGTDAVVDLATAGRPGPRTAGRCCCWAAADDLKLGRVASDPGGGAPGRADGRAVRLGARRRGAAELPRD